MTTTGREPATLRHKKEIMLKWVVTRGPGALAPDVPRIDAQRNCSCDKENHCEELFEIENNNSYAFNDLGNFFSPRKSRVSSGPLIRFASHDCVCSPYSPRFDGVSSSVEAFSKSKTLPTKEDPSCTPLTSRSSTQGRTRKLRSRRERNKTLVKRLCETSLGDLSEIATPKASQRQTVDPVSDLFKLYRDPGSAELLQNLLHSNQVFNEREVKTPEGPSPLECGRLFRQRAVRRKQSKAVTSLHQLQFDPNDSASIFNCFVFRELAQEGLL
ncbi:uncharacterized protein LOC129768409 isoform X2 [Toxorhynchites rutilus septentrionalis]|uniref:uncharacterized protein LOC129768409 isoform X2 n=1 Tax=Toxorhynchites rutilus septentrionalis TaxID=329112 RepID=UPI00247A099C|nr:uncharacterized protein LOC129768409 isoform X2 [Toxorhynchites rutilus septentrionalis]